MSITENQNEIKYWVGFSQFTKIGPVRFKKIYSYFPAMALAWQASFQELLESGLENEVAEEIVIRRNEINLDLLLENIEREKIRVITIRDKNYPRLLKEIYNPPALLYIRGEIKKQDEFSLAIVGTRKVSNYGKQIAPEISRELGKNGLTIVSGLALGIDALAHQAALEAGGRTIAVLGSGLDRQSIYPTANRYLADKISASGSAVISEFPLGMLPLKHNFPNRNRIISGLSLGTLVIEAAEDSGALITAKYALEQNREVFAIPGSIYNPTSVGPNNLLKMGAKVVTSALDIQDALNLTQAATFIENQKIVPETREEEIILNLLSHEPVHVDKIIGQSGLGAPAVNSVLLMMEMRGKVKNLGGANYVLAR